MTVVRSTAVPAGTEKEKPATGTGCHVEVARRSKSTRHVKPAGVMRSELVAGSSTDTSPPELNRPTICRGTTVAGVPGNRSAAAEHVNTARPDTAPTPGK